MKASDDFQVPKRYLGTSHRIGLKGDDTEASFFSSWCEWVFGAHHH